MSLWVRKQTGGIKRELFDFFQVTQTTVTRSDSREPKRKFTHASVVVVIPTNFALLAGDVWSLTRQSKTCRALFLEDVLFWLHCRNT